MTESTIAQLYEDGDPPVLLGARCDLCGEVVFPAMLDCPACLTFASMRPSRLDGAGILRDFIVVHRGPSGFAVPYIQGYITLDDGPIVYSLIDAPPEPVDLSLGQRMTMIIDTIRFDEDGTPMLGWKFRPA